MLLYVAKCCYIIYVVYVYIYIWMVVDQNSFIREQPFFANKQISNIFWYLSRILCEAMFICRGAHVEQQLPLLRFIQRLPSRTKLSPVISS